MGLVEGLATQQDDEFLAAVAGNVAVVVRDLRQRLRGAAQDPVSCFMSMRIVDPLEMVEVAEGDA